MRPVAAALGAALLIAGVVWLASRSAPSEAPGSLDVAEREAAPRRFDLHLHQRSSALLVETTIAGGIELRGALAVQDDPARQRSLIVLERIDSLAWTVEGREVEGGEARLLGARAEVSWDADGAITDVVVPEETAPEVARLLRTLALALQAPTPAASGRALEVPLGRARVRSEGTDGRLDVRWSGADYEHVAGAREGAAVRADAAHAYQRAGSSPSPGALARARYRERLEVLAGDGERALLSAELEVDVIARDERVAALTWTSGPLVSAARVASSASRRALEGRVAGMIFTQLLDDLVRYGAGGVMPAHERWLWRASGLLLLEPERAAELARACTDGTLEGAGRALALDLLANVGHSEAQAGLRAVLADPGVVGGSDYPALLQRAVLVEDPEDATIGFFEERMAALEGASYRSSASALGALVGRARARDPELGGPEVERLSRALDDASSSADRRALLMALGNAGAREAEPRVLRHASSDDAEERAAAVRALGRIGGEAGRGEVLSRALEDPSPGVRTEALAALARLDPRDEELLVLAEATRAGRIARSDLPALASLARRVVDARGGDRATGSTDALVALLEALLASPELPSDVRHQLAALRLALRG